MDSQSDIFSSTSIEQSGYPNEGDIVYYNDGNMTTIGNYRGLILKRLQNNLPLSLHAIKSHGKDIIGNGIHIYNRI
jgi:hypothetical protein